MNLDLIELDEKDCLCFLTLPDEKILVAKRQHPFVLAGPIITIILINSFIAILGNGLNYLVTKSLVITFTFNIFLLLFTFAFILKSIVDRYYHLFIITTRKILEIRCIPFFSDHHDNVFLDQVRTTEVDTNIGTFIHELLDMGDVTIAFDRPSHERVFTVKNIKNPRETAAFLANKLEQGMAEPTIWFKPRRAHDMVSSIEDVYPVIGGSI